MMTLLQPFHTCLSQLRLGKATGNSKLKTRLSHHATPANTITLASSDLLMTVLFCYGSEEKNKATCDSGSAGSNPVTVDRGITC
jgi:hypothetical protein